MPAIRRWPAARSTARSTSHDRRTSRAIVGYVLCTACAATFIYLAQSHIVHDRRSHGRARAHRFLRHASICGSRSRRWSSSSSSRRRCSRWLGPGLVLCVLPVVQVTGLDHAGRGTLARRARRRARRRQDLHPRPDPAGARAAVHRDLARGQVPREERDRHGRLPARRLRRELARKGLAAAAWCAGRRRRGARRRLDRARRDARRRFAAASPPGPPAPVRAGHRADRRADADRPPPKGTPDARSPPASCSDRSPPRAAAACGSKRDRPLLPPNR